MSHFDPNIIKKALESVLLPDGKSIPLHEPFFGGREWEYLKDCLDTGYVSSVGSYVDRFEAMLADYTGAKYAVATVNGTMALHLCLRLAGVQAEEEVLIPALTFVAPANAVAYCGAIPHLVDSREDSLGMDTLKLKDYLEEFAEIKSGVCLNRRTRRRISAIVPVHVFGHPVDMDPLNELAARYNLVVIEDAAEAIGSRYKGRMAGTLGKLGALSFNGNKTITTGGGGAILTDDPELASLAKHLSTTAKKPHPWNFFHDQLGYNYRMPNINAALGCAQLEQLPRFLKLKRNLAEKYQNVFREVQGVRFIKEPEYAESNYWLNALYLEDSAKGERDALLELLNKDGIMVRPVWNLMHCLPMYKNCPSMDLSVGKKLEAGLINLPSSMVLARES